MKAEAKQLISCEWRQILRQMVTLMHFERVTSVVNERTNGSCSCSTLTKIWCMLAGTMMRFELVFNLVVLGQFVEHES